MRPLEILSGDGFLEYLKNMKFAEKYDSSTEPKKPHPWWDIDKLSAIAYLKAISERITECLQGTPTALLDKELQHIGLTAGKLEKWRRGEPTKVALIGSQGAGKSLLINALLDCEGLSLTGASGFACTSAIVKYAYSPGDRFAAEVTFLNAKMREEMIDEHIRSYLRYYNDLEDSDDEGSAPTSRTCQQDELDSQRRKTAEDFFDTLFGSRDDFLSAWGSQPVNTVEFKKLCQLGCEDAMRKFDADSQDTVRISKATPKELLESILPFLTNVKDTICLWPIVNCVTIRLNHPILEGNELWDLPGSGDTNLTRAKHADAVKDAMNVLLFLANTDRIGTNDPMIKGIRAALQNLKSSMVKVIATKIDILPEGEMDQYIKDEASSFNDIIRQVDEDATEAEMSGNDARVVHLSRYKDYLQRLLKSVAIQNRADIISNTLGANLAQYCFDGGAIEIFHTSTANYMKWIQKGKIPFASQPALSPQDCGVPALRQYLYNLTVPQNMRGFVEHINFGVPAFVDKLQRVITQSDRDAGFITIAKDFDDLRGRYLGDMQKQVAWHTLKYARCSIKKVRKDTEVYKERVKALIEKRWLTLKAPAFNRILKSRGVVPKGVSKAQGLENGVNWPAELAAILKPGFQHWYEIHSADLLLLKDALPLQLDGLYKRTCTIIENSKADLITVEKAKRRWGPYRHRMGSKILALMEEMITEERRFLNRVTLKDERENNFITEITNDIFDEISMCAPPQKKTKSGKTQYVSSLVKFRRDRLEAHFLDEKEHFVDRLIINFQSHLEEKMGTLIQKHFEKLEASLDEFSKLMVSQGPITFEVDPRGLAIRRELEKHIPFIQEQADRLLEMLPADSKTEDYGFAGDDDDDGSGELHKLDFYIEKIYKEKRKLPSSTTERNTEPAAKKIKLESD